MSVVGGQKTVQISEVFIFGHVAVNIYVHCALYLFFPQLTYMKGIVHPKLTILFKTCMLLFSLPLNTIGESLKTALIRIWTILWCFC